MHTTEMKAFDIRLRKLEETCALVKQTQAEETPDETLTQRKGNSQTI